MLPELINDISHTDILQQHKGIIGLRKLLSNLDPLPIKQIKYSKIIPRIIQLLRQEEYPQLQYEGTWVMTNLTSSDEIVTEKKQFEQFLLLLHSRNIDIAVQAVWLISNLVAQKTEFRDLAIESGGVESIIQLFKKCEYNEKKSCCWALSNLCKGRPLPKY